MKRKVQEANERGIPSSTFTIKTTLGDVLNPTRISLAVFNGFKHQALELVRRMRNISFHASLLSYFHVLRLFEAGQINLHSLDQKFFYQCLKAVCNSGKEHTADQLENLNGAARRKADMENAVMESYRLFLAIELRDAPVEAAEADQEEVQEQEPARQFLQMNSVGLSYFLPSCATDMAKNVSNHVSAHYPDVKLKEFYLQIMRENDQMTANHAKKLAIHLFKLLHTPDATFWPTSVPQTMQLNQYMTGLYQQHHNRPGFELFSVVKAKSRPELYLFGMVESLHEMELIHQDANDNPQPRNPDPQNYITIGYAKKKIRKLNEHEFLSTNQRTALSQFMAQCIHNPIVMESFAQWLIPVQEEGLNMHDYIISLLDDQNFLNYAIDFFVNEGIITQAVRRIILHHRFSEESALIYLKTIIKIALKIIGGIFTPKQNSIARGNRLFKVMPLYSYQDRFVDSTRRILVHVESSETRIAC